MFNPSIYIREEIVSIDIGSLHVRAEETTFVNNFEVHSIVNIGENGTPVIDTSKYRLYFKVVLGAFQMQKVKIEEVSKEYCD